MIELVDNQTSGNDWGLPNHAMLHEQPQESSSPALPHNQRLIFRNFERQMAQYEADHRVLVAEVRRHYVLPGDASVIDFFGSHRILPSLLLQAVPHLKEFFGPDTVFNLRAPIDEPGAQTLYAVAMWAGRVKDVRMSLDSFDEVWWIPNSRQASGYLTFTYELI
jgi:hypothetical protein